MKFQQKIQKFMYGRYGFDELYNFLFFVYIFLLIIDLFLDSKILTLIEFITIFIIVYRVLSKKIYIRSNENQKYLKIRRKISKWFENVKDKDHIYKKCRYCKTILKLPLPNKIGIKYVKCPKCKKKNKVLALKRQKVEIIKNKRRGTR